MRLDQFLDTICVFKTRSAAAKAIRGGDVMIGGHPAKASHSVHPGEVIEIAFEKKRLVIEVTGVPPGAVSKKEAQSYYRVREGSSIESS